MVLAIYLNSLSIITLSSKVYFYAIAQIGADSTFELHTETPIKSFGFFLTQFKMGEP